MISEAILNSRDTLSMFAVEDDVEQADTGAKVRGLPEGIPSPGDTGFRSRAVDLYTAITVITNAQTYISRYCWVSFRFQLTANPVSSNMSAKATRQWHLKACTPCAKLKIRCDYDAHAVKCKRYDRKSLYFCLSINELLRPDALD